MTNEKIIICHLTRSCPASFHIRFCRVCYQNHIRLVFRHCRFDCRALSLDSVVRVLEQLVVRKCPSAFDKETWRNKKEIKTLKKMREFFLPVIGKTDTCLSALGKTQTSSKTDLVYRWAIILWYICLISKRYNEGIFKSIWSYVCFIARDSTVIHFTMQINAKIENNWNSSLCTVGKTGIWLLIE